MGDVIDINRNSVADLEPEEDLAHIAVAILCSAWKCKIVHMTMEHGDGDGISMVTEIGEDHLKEHREAHPDIEFGLAIRLVSVNLEGVFEELEDKWVKKLLEDDSE